MDLPEIGEVVYRPLRAFTTVLGAAQRITTIDFAKQREGNGFMCCIEYSFEYNAWFLTNARRLRAFVDGDVPSNVTHFEVTKVGAASIKMQPLPADEDWLAKQFPSNNGWDQGVLRLRRIAKEEPQLFLDLFQDSDLVRVIDRNLCKALLSQGLTHETAQTGADVLKALDTLRVFVEQDFDRFGDLRDTLRESYVQVLEALVPKE